MSEPVLITSSSNRIIKEIRSLHDKKGRSSLKAMLLEGSRLVSDAASSGANIRYFVASDSFYKKNSSFFSYYPDKKVVCVPDSLFARIGETRTPQGVMAVADIPVYDISSIILKAKRIVVLENLQDPGNIGTIIRSADACGFDAVLLSKDCADPFNSKTIRSTMGSVFHIPVIVAEDFYRVLSELKANNILLAAAHTREALPCWQADLKGDVAVIIGNEGNGITDKIIELSDLTVMIPMDGNAESLNAAAAASILIYECLRQKKLSEGC
ncbi:MAG: RNA methyltransferase [Clostridiaceae bacterium]|nr:RNA methyltransferase [Clostridiaceae bacterium]